MQSKYRPGLHHPTVGGEDRDIGEAVQEVPRALQPAHSEGQAPQPDSLKGILSLKNTQKWVSMLKYLRGKRSFYIIP